MLILLEYAENYKKEVTTILLMYISLDDYITLRSFIIQTFYE